MDTRMHIAISPLATACIVALLLTACGGDGGGGMVRTTPPPPSPPASPPPPPPQPPQRTLTLPTAPPTSATPTPPALAETRDYLVDIAGGSASLDRPSTSGALTLRQGRLFLNGPARFDAGAQVEAGTLDVWGDLFADLEIAHGATVELRGDVIGDVVNNGILDPSDEGGWYDAYYDAEIFGDYTQSAEGMLRLWFGLQGMTPATPLLTVNGTATLDGTLEFHSSGFIPAGGYLEWVLHASDGVVGQFAGWSTAGTPLFITGELRHESNDVYLLASRVSTQAVMAAAGSDRLTMGTAAHIDAAFAAGDELAGLPGAALSGIQGRFLQSAAAIQNLRDYDQAFTAFDSLAGHAHLRGQDALHAQAAGMASKIDADAATLAYDARPRSWSGDHVDAVAEMSGRTRLSGIDQWLGPRWLVGGSLAQAAPSLRFERMGGSGHAEAPMASVYAHYRGDGWHATGLFGASRATLDLSRPLALGMAGTHVATSHRSLDQAFAHVEAGRRATVAGGTLTPFVALDYSALRGDAFVEAGDTGFELRVDASDTRRLSDAFGMRFRRDWRFAGGGWLRMDAEARREHLLDASGQTLAAFTGVPGVRFALDDGALAAPSYRWNLRLAGGDGGRWTWTLDHAGQPGASLWFAGLQRAF